MILAVVHRHINVQLHNQDVYVSTIGGARVTEPAADLAIALAALSAVADKPVPVGTIAIGEIGLAGEIRSVTGISRRLSEAARLGFTRAIVPMGTDAKAPSGLTLLPVANVREALDKSQPAVRLPTRIDA